MLIPLYADMSYQSFPVLLGYTIASRKHFKKNTVYMVLSDYMSNYKLYNLPEPFWGGVLIDKRVLFLNPV